MTDVDENLRDKCIFHPSIEDMEDMWMIYCRWMVTEGVGRLGVVGSGSLTRATRGGLDEAWWSVYEYRSTFTTSTLINLFLGKTKKSGIVY